MGVRPVVSPHRQHPPIGLDSQTNKKNKGGEQATVLFLPPVPRIRQSAPFIVPKTNDMAPIEPIMPAELAPSSPPPDYDPVDHDPSFSSAGGRRSLSAGRGGSLQLLPRGASSRSASTATARTGTSMRARFGLMGVARRTLGIILLLMTVILWTVSNFLASVSGSIALRGPNELGCHYLLVLLALLALRQDETYADGQCSTYFPTTHTANPSSSYT